MNKKKIIKIVFLSCIVLLLGVVVFFVFRKEEEQVDKDVVVECCGEKLTYSDIALYTQGHKGEDSARLAEEYITNWATECLMFKNASKVENPKIEKMVEEYRRSLYIYEYEQSLISQRTPVVIEDTVVRAFYEERKAQMILQEMLIKGALVVVPNEAPNIDQLRKHLKQMTDEESLEWIEKYAYQYALGYELFIDDWKARENVLEFVPLEIIELDKMLGRGKLIEVQDSVNTYFLQMEDYCAVGSVMPFDYARKQIEDNVYRTSNEEFLMDIRKKLYEESLKNGKIKRYAK
jgi:hypothetical protein